MHVMVKSNKDDMSNQKENNVQPCLLQDSVYSIREAAIHVLQAVAKEFGADWAREHIVPQVRRTAVICSGGAWRITECRYTATKKHASVRASPTRPSRGVWRVHQLTRHLLLCLRRCCL